MGWANRWGSAWWFAASAFRAAVRAASVRTSYQALYLVRCQAEDARSGFDRSADRGKSRGLRCSEVHLPATWRSA